MELADDQRACIEGLDTIQSMLGTPDAWTLPQRLLFATHPAKRERLRLLRSAASSPDISQPLATGGGPERAASDAAS